MLNWVIIIAFRLVRDYPGKYSNEQIVKLIENIHNTLVGEIFRRSGDLVNRTFMSDDIDPDAHYITKVKEWMMSKIFDDFALRDIVPGIKEELQKLPEHQIGMTEVTKTDVKSQKITSNRKISKTTQKGFRRIGGGVKENNVTRKHQHDRVEETTKHTRKHKIYTLCLNKTRRNK